MPYERSEIWRIEFILYLRAQIDYDAYFPRVQSDLGEIRC
jgi:hypothetical protein